MVDTRAGYIWTTIDDDITINGGILPSRDNGGAGIDHWRVLRGEDVAFAIEAACERGAVSGVGLIADEWRTVDRNIIGERWVQVITHLHSMVGSAVKVAADPQTKIIGADIPLTAKVTDIWPAIKVDANDLVADVNMFGSGEGLRAEPIRDVFRDVSKLRAFQHNGTWTRSTNSYSTSVSGGVVAADVSASGNTVYNYLARKYGGFLEYLNGHGSARADVGTFTFTPASTSADFQTVSTFRHILEFTVTISRSTTEETHHAVSVVSSNSLEMPMSSVASAAASLCILVNGGPLPTEDTLAEGSGFICTANLNSARAVAYLGDHTDFSHIPWS